MEPIRNRRSKTEYIQGWANDVSFHDKTVTIEEAIRDPQQGLALVNPRYEGVSEEARDKLAIEKTDKGQLFDLKYDKLVISVGCYSQTFNTV